MHCALTFSFFYLEQWTRFLLVRRRVDVSFSRQRQLSEPETGPLLKSRRPPSRTCLLLTQAMSTKRRLLPLVLTLVGLLTQPGMMTLERMPVVMQAWVEPMTTLIWVTIWAGATTTAWMTWVTLERKPNQLLLQLTTWQDFQTMLASKCLLQVGLLLGAGLPTAHTLPITWPLEEHRRQCSCFTDRLQPATSQISRDPCSVVTLVPLSAYQVRQISSLMCLVDLDDIFHIDLTFL